MVYTYSRYQDLQQLFLEPSLSQLLIPKFLQVPRGIRLINFEAILTQWTEYSPHNEVNNCNSAFKLIQLA